MADLKITQLDEALSVAGTDIIPVVVDPGGSPVTKKVPVTTLLAGLGLDTVGAGFSIIMGDGTNVIPTGVKGVLEVPFDMEITEVRLFAPLESGSIVIDIWKDSYSNFPPTDDDSITYSTPPTLASAQKSQDTTLASWTVALSKGDILAFNVDSASTVTLVTLSVIGVRSVP